MDVLTTITACVPDPAFRTDRGGFVAFHEVLTCPHLLCIPHHNATATAMVATGLHAFRVLGPRRSTLAYFKWCLWMVFFYRPQHCRCILANKADLCTPLLSILQAPIPHLAVDAQYKLSVDCASTFTWPLERCQEGVIGVQPTIVFEAIDDTEKDWFW